MRGNRVRNVSVTKGAGWPGLTRRADPDDSCGERLGLGCPASDSKSGPGLDQVPLRRRESQAQRSENVRAKGNALAETGATVNAACRAATLKAFTGARRKAPKGLGEPLRGARALNPCDRWQGLD